MFNLFSSLSKNEETPNSNYYKGVTISFQQLVEKIKRPNPLVEVARSYGKGSDEYDTIKKKHFECFFANGYNEHNNRSTKNYFNSTGYIYLDFDGFSTIEDTNAFKSKIAPHNFIAACWISLSGKGLSALVKVNPEKCNKYQYLQYWDWLNKLFDNEVDPRTRDFYRICMVSSDPDIYFNHEATPIDTIHSIEYESSLLYSTPIPLEKFENVNKPVVYPQGLDTIKLDFYKYRLKKIKSGRRTSTLGAISMQLIHLNPDATKKHILTAMLSHNRSYCSKPLTEKEVQNIVSANYKKKDALDVSKYLKKRYVFFHPECKMPRKLKSEIRGEEMRKITKDIIVNAIENLINEVKPNKMTINLIQEYTCLSTSTIYDNLDSKMKSFISSYNKDQKSKVKNVSFSSDCLYTLKGYNMRTMEKETLNLEITSVQESIYSALEELQDGMKITQQRIADYLSVSLKTINRNLLEQFKLLIKHYNDSLKKIQPERLYAEIEPLILRSVVDQQNTIITKESIAQHTGLVLTVIEQNWSDGICDLVSMVNAQENKCGVLINGNEDTYRRGGLDYRNKLNPLTLNSNFEEHIIKLEKSRIYNHRQESRTLISEPKNRIEESKLEKKTTISNNGADVYQIKKTPSLEEQVRGDLNDPLDICNMPKTLNSDIEYFIESVVVEQPTKMGVVSN